MSEIGDPAQNRSISIRPLLRELDPDLHELLYRDEFFYGRSLDLIAGLGIPTEATVEAMMLAQPNRTQEGHIGRRFIGAGGAVDEIEELAIKRACQAFGFGHANVQVHSGTQANLAVQQAFADPGDTLVSMALQHGGHLSHGYRKSLSGSLFRVQPYHVHEDTGLVDLDEVRELCRRHRPRVLIAGSSAYPRELPYQAFAEIAAEVGAILVLDISHTAGFIGAGLQNVPHDDHVVLTMTTEKTLCGPRGGLIVCSTDLGPAIDSAVFPKLQSSFSVNIVSGKAAVLRQAQSRAYRCFQESILENAQVLARTLQEHGQKLISGGTDTHLLVTDLNSIGVSGQYIERLLLECGVMSSRQMLPGDKRTARETTGIRFGTTCISARNMPRADVQKLGCLLAEVLASGSVPPEVKQGLLSLGKSQVGHQNHPLFLRAPTAV